GIRARFLFKTPPRRSEGEELEYPFFEGDGLSFDEWGDYGVAGDDYEGPSIFDDDQFEEELEMRDDAFVLIGKEVTLNSEIPEAMFPLLKEFSDVFHDELPDALPPLCDIQHHIDLEPSSQLPNRPHYKLCPGEHEELRRQDFVEGLPYHGDSSNDDLVGNSRTNFFYPCGNDGGPSVEEQALLFLEAQDLGIRVRFLFKMLPRRSEGEELEYPFFEGDGSSFDEWRDYGVAGKEVAPNSKIPEAMFPLLEEFSDVFHDEFPDALPPLLCPREHEELGRQVEEFVYKGHIRKIMSMCAQPRGPLDLMSLYDSGSVPKRVQDFVEGLPYHSDSSDDDLVGNSRTNFFYPWGNDAGRSVEERALFVSRGARPCEEKVFIQSVITW
nr:putative reverse transcriptase domain-containing protein [Tanacetum cinerariifolium]